MHTTINFVVDFRGEELHDEVNNKKVLVWVPLGEIKIFVPFYVTILSCPHIKYRAVEFFVFLPET